MAQGWVPSDDVPWRPLDPPTESFEWLIDWPPSPVVFATSVDFVELGPVPEVDASPTVHGIEIGSISASAINILPDIHAGSGVGMALGTSTPEPDRFIDLTLYEGLLYVPEDSGGATKLKDADPLLSTQNYTVEVAIRRTRSGVGANMTATSPVLNPRVTDETLNILAVATKTYGPIEIENPVARLFWQPNEDSTPAYLRLRPCSLQEQAMQAEIEVRLYHINLDLLDVVRLTVTVTTDTAIAVSKGSELRWFHNEKAQPLLAPDKTVRAMNITVSRARPDGYQFTILFLRKEDKPEVRFIRYLSAGDLQVLLRRVRDFWTNLAIKSPYAIKLTVSELTWLKSLIELRKIGSDAWVLLFGDAEGGNRSSSEEVGDLLRDLDLATGTLIQVCQDERALDFVFPWALLHPPSPDNSEPDPGQFWGARFQIEQVWHGRNVEDLGSGPVHVSAAIDPKFGLGQAQAQKAMFKDFCGRAMGQLLIDDRLTDLTTLLTAFRADPASHLYYFFCHGYAPAGSAILQPDGVQMVEKAIAAAPEETQELFRTLLTLTALMKDEAWIFLGDAQVAESTLRQQPNFFSKRRPIIFMNMCHSAALSPSMNSGLVRLFFGRSASAVIGTEAPMTSIFAHAFAEQFFGHLFSGCDVGTALQRARLYFLTEDRHNPLALAYTLYGRATAAVCRETIILPQKHVEQPGLAAK